MSQSGEERVKKSVDQVLPGLEPDPGAADLQQLGQEQDGGSLGLWGRGLAIPPGPETLPTS